MTSSKAVKASPPQHREHGTPTVSRRNLMTWAVACLAGCETDFQVVHAAPSPSAELTAAPPADRSTSRPPPASPRSIALQPLGPDLSQAQVELVQTALQAFYGYDVMLLPRLALPTSAFYQPRKRYRAEKLLPLLVQRKPKTAFRILGLTSSDISTTKGSIHDWGILGLATIDGVACVISSYRTRRGAKTPRQADERFAKTAVHELGHTLGLEHCPNHGCLMADGKGSVFTTDHEYDLCSDCRTQLAVRGVPLPTSDPPWPRP